MPKQAPPIDASPFLNDAQRKDVARMPAPYRRIGAWLMLIRDDKTGEWKERPVRCIECAGQKIPCMDRVNPGTKRRRCESCFLGDMKCSPGAASNEPRQNSSTVPGTSASGRRKRKLEPDAASSSASKSARKASRKAAPVPVGVRRPGRTGHAVVDLTSDEERPSKGRRGAGPGALSRAASTSSPRTSVIRIPESSSGDSDRDDSDGDSSSDSDGAATPQLRMPRASSQSSRRSSTSTTPPKPRAVPRAVVPFYHNDQIRAILAHARQLTRFSVNAELITRGERVGESTLQQFDYTVLVRAPAETSTWLVVVADNRKLLARVLFSKAKGRICTKPSTRAALERAFHMFRNCVSMEGVVCPRLADNKGGGFYAAALAVDAIRSLPGIPTREIMVNETEAEAALDRLQSAVHRPEYAVSWGRASEVVARISRHDGRFEFEPR